MDDDDAVARQLTAYNARDIDSFLACFHELVVVEDGKSRLLMRGIGELRQSYGPMFRNYPDLRADVRSRARIGEYVIDEAIVSGTGSDPQHGVLIYHLEEGLIDHVRIIR